MADDGMKTAPPLTTAAMVNDNPPSPIGYSPSLLLSSVLAATPATECKKVDGDDVASLNGGRRHRSDEPAPAMAAEMKMFVSGQDIHEFESFESTLGHFQFGFSSG
ncbi:hypothetical protein Hdeb2414_s0003g00105281 [Helianthus debilis subsp. tardiflorus]